MLLDGLDNNAEIARETSSKRHSLARTLATLSIHASDAVSSRRELNRLSGVDELPIALTLGEFGIFPHRGGAELVQERQVGRPFSTDVLLVGVKLPLEALLLLLAL